MVDIVHAASRLSGLTELSEVRKVWFSDWYDGPLTGVALYEGREYWFVMVTNDYGEHWDFEPRVYVLHRLAEVQLAQAWEMHRRLAEAGIPGVPALATVHRCRRRGRRGVGGSPRSLAA